VASGPTFSKRAFSIVHTSAAEGGSAEQGRDTSRSTGRVTPPLFQDGRFTAPAGSLGASASLLAASGLAVRSQLVLRAACVVVRVGVVVGGWPAVVRFGGGREPPVRPVHASSSPRPAATRCRRSPRRRRAGAPGAG